MHARIGVIERSWYVNR